MHYAVFMLQEAEHDLEAIFQYIIGSGNPGAAKDMIKLIRQACDSLSHMPERDHVPPELDFPLVLGSNGLHFAERNTTFG